MAAGLEASPFDPARWISGDAAAIRDLVSFNGANMAKDRDGNLVFMTKSAWYIGYQQERHPKVKFSATKERRGNGAAADGSGLAPTPSKQGRVRIPQAERQ